MGRVMFSAGDSRAALRGLTERGVSRLIPRGEGRRHMLSSKVSTPCILIYLLEWQTVKYFTVASIFLPPHVRETRERETGIRKTGPYGDTVVSKYVYDFGGAHIFAIRSRVVLHCIFSQLGPSCRVPG